ncbi:MAG: pyocin activator PrtN family protein [Vibrio sp.]
MNTKYALLVVYGSPIIPVQDVCEDVFNCQKKTAHHQIVSYTFPVPAFRLTEKTSGDFFITVDDLASYIDQQLAASSSYIEHLFCLILLRLAYFCPPS